MFAIKNSKIVKASYLYIALPVMCFLTLYMSSWIGIFCFIIFSITISILLKKDEKPELVIWIPAKYLFVFVAAAVVWTYLGGQGNLYYQSDDWHFRNAVYRDLLYYKWPVVYPEFHKALVYYIGHWLPPAALTKVIGVFVPHIYDTEIMFQIGNIFLWIWSAIGIFLVECLLLAYVKPNGKKVFLIPLILIFFSGLDIVGVLRDIVKYGDSFEELHIEWWSQGLQFSSLTTCLFWAFNQAIIPWIVILCVLSEESIKNYVFMGLCALAAGPMPFVGIVVYMTAYAVYRGILMLSQGQWKIFRKEFLGIENLLSLVIMPIFLVYYRTNSSVIAGTENVRTVSVSVFTIRVITITSLKEIFFFLMLEAGVYLIIIYRKYRNELFFYVTVGSVLLAPFIRVGKGNDFVMRFSIPAVMVIAAMTIKFIAEYDSCVKAGKDRICYAALWICLVLGAITPFTELERGYNALLKNGRIINVADDVKTMNQDNIDSEIEENIMAYDYEKNVFFRYFISEE